MRRRLLIGSAGLLCLLLLAALTTWGFYGRIGSWAIREKVLPKLEARLGREVEVGEIRVSRGEVVLLDVTLPSTTRPGKDLLTIASLTIDFDYRASWFGTIKLFEARIQGLKLEDERSRDGSTELEPLLRKLVHRAGSRAGPPVHGEKSTLAKLRPARLRLRDATLILRDLGSGHRVLAHLESAQADAGQEASAHLSSLQVDERATLYNLEVEVDPASPLSSARIAIGGGHLTLWPGMSLSGISGTIKQGDHPEQLVIALSGSYGGAGEKLWDAQGWLDPKSRRGELSVVADRFTFNRIESVLRDSVVKDFQNTSVDAELLLKLEKGVLDFSGALNLSGLNVEHPMLAAQRLTDMNLDIGLSGSVDRRSKHLRLDSVSVISRGVRYLLSGDYYRAGGVEASGEKREHDRLAFRVKVPTTDCQAVLQSIPAAMVPKLQGFHLRGPFSADVVLEIDWQDLAATTVLSGSVALSKCRVLSPSEEFDTDRLLSSFEHQILVGPDAEYKTVEIGMESDNYVQIFDISSYFLNAVLTQEDSKFYEHNGFIPREFRSALVRNLQAGRFKFGASSITMQMVKNVFLSREKTISRKLQELFLTWYVELTLEKNRIFEIYVNAIEYGPAVYGIVRASEIYFGKHPRDLTPREAVFLANLLPAPRKRYFQYCRDRLNRQTANKIVRVLKNMHNRDRLSDQEYSDALESKIEFNPKKVRKLCRKPPDW